MVGLVSVRLSALMCLLAASVWAAEDEGWLMGYVVDMAHQTTDLVILDAHHFSGPPQAIVRIPHRIPSGFHGNWVPAA